MNKQGWISYVRVWFSWGATTVMCRVWVALELSMIAPATLSFTVHDPFGPETSLYHNIDWNVQQPIEKEHDLILIDHVPQCKTKFYLTWHLWSVFDEIHCLLMDRDSAWNRYSTQNYKPFTTCHPSKKWFIWGSFSRSILVIPLCWSVTREFTVTPSSARAFNPLTSPSFSIAGELISVSTRWNNMNEDLKNYVNKIAWGMLSVCLCVFWKKTQRACIRLQTKFKHYIYVSEREIFHSWGCWDVLQFIGEDKRGREVLHSLLPNSGWGMMFI